MRPTCLLFAALCMTACGGPDVDVGGDGSGDGDGGVVVETGTDSGGTDMCALPFSGEGHTLITGRMGPRRLSTDGTWLYVTVAGALSQKDGQLLRVPLAGGDVEVIASDLSVPDAVVAESGAVFVVDTQGLWRVDLPGLQRTRLHDALNGALLGGSELVALPDALLYMSGFRRIVRVARDGTNAQVLHEAPAGSAVRGSAMHEGALYFLVIDGGPDARGLWRVPVDGSAAASRISAEPEDGRALTVWGQSLLWAESSGEVRALALTGDAQPELLGTGLLNPARLLLVDGALYAKTGGGGGGSGTSFFMARDACGDVREVGPVGVGPGDLLHHGGALYFTSEDRTGQGYVARLP